MIQRHPPGVLVTHHVDFQGPKDPAGLEPGSGCLPVSIRGCNLEEKQTPFSHDRSNHGIIERSPIEEGPNLDLQLCIPRSGWIVVVGGQVEAIFHTETHSKVVAPVELDRESTIEGKVEARQVYIERNIKPFSKAYAS